MEGRGQMPNGIETQGDRGSNWETEVCVALTLLPLSFFVSLFILLLAFEIVSCYVDEPGLELSVTPLPLPLKCWYHQAGLLMEVLFLNFIFLKCKVRLL